MGDRTMPPEANAGSASPMTWVDQILVGPDGFVGTMAVLDLETGAYARAVFTLDSAGSALGVHPIRTASPGLLDGVTATAEVGFRSVLTALAGSRTLRKRATDLAPLLASPMLRDVASVAVTETRLWILTGDARTAGPGAPQRILAVDLTAPGALRPQDLALGPLRLGPTRVITTLARLAEDLVVAVSDPVQGFDLFRLAPDGTGFTNLLGQGGLRFAVNAAVSAVGQGPEGLLIGTAALATGADAPGSWGPELIEVRPDGSWRLIVGMPRFTPTGRVVPLSGQKAGFDQPANAAITAVASGTLNGRALTCIAVQDHFGPPVEDRREVETDLMAYAGPVRLYGSADLVTWSQIKARLPEGMGCVTSLAIGARGLLIGHEGSDPRQVPAYLLHS